MSAKMNRLYLSGESNIVLQDIANSVVEIRTGNSPEDIARLSEYLRRWIGQKRLSLLVVASTAEGLTTIKSTPKKPHPLERYGLTPADWKPFGQETIAELLASFYLQSRIETDVIFVDGWQPDRSQRTELTESLREQVILIADPLSLSAERNKALAKIFDSSRIGGLLVPICQSYTTRYRHHLRILRKRALPDLEACFFGRFVQSYAHLEPEIHSKELFFRRLSNIAITVRGIMPQPQNFLSEYFQKYQNSAAFRMQSASFDETKISPAL